MTPLEYLYNLRLGRAKQVGVDPSNVQAPESDNAMAFPALTDPGAILGYMGQQSAERKNQAAGLSRALSGRKFQTDDEGTAILADDAGNVHDAPSGLAGQQLGNMIAQQYDQKRIGDYYDKLRSGNKHAINSAAIGGFPMPTGVLAGPGWRARSGTMRGLMLGNKLFDRKAR